MCFTIGVVDECVQLSKKLKDLIISLIHVLF